MNRLKLRTILAFGAVGAALAACGDSGTKTEVEPTPPPYAQDTFGKCAWEHVKGAEIGIWSYNCGPDFGNTKLVADNALPGFAVVSTRDGVEDKAPVIRIFKKDASAPIEAILDQVRAASPGPHIATCTLQPNTSVTDRKLFQLTPDAAAAAEWDKYQSDGAGDVKPPCGEMGPQFVGDNYFTVLGDDPTTVVWVNSGSEIPIFNSRTLHKIKK